MFWPILRGCTAQEQMKKEMQAISYRSFAWKKMAVKTMCVCVCVTA